MSIALGRIEPSGITRAMACAAASIFESSPEMLPEDRRVVSAAGDPARERKEEELDWCSSSSTSSIGRNSDLSDGEDGEETEVQSWYNGPLNMVEALEEVLPMRRGISKFYNGKSKSYTTLADASSSSSSSKDLAKPENAYAKRRRNLLAINHIWDKNRNLPLKGNGGGISKRPISSSRSTLALAFAMSSSENNSNTSDDSNSSSTSRSPPRLPPLHPQARASHNNIPSSPPLRNFSPWRSFSLADLQQCANGGTNNPNFSSNNDKDNH